MTSPDFARLYSRRMMSLAVPYDAAEFLYPKNEPWPEKSFDYPFAQAPTVSNLPAQELNDWDTYVGRYYRDNALKFGLEASAFSADAFAKNGVAGYGPVSDETFLELLSEGLYSKFLVTLDASDKQLFGIGAEDEQTYQYLKSDLSCMKVVRKAWDGEYLAPAIAVIRRPANQPWSYDYELVAIALAKSDGKGGYAFGKELVFDAKLHAQYPSWWLAKYFVLQGTIHRINLVDHIRVHFPSDTINAITKSVLPRWHFLQQLLLPHLWLTLPVNNTVLEGDRSLINRDTWYPWSPLVAKGAEIRRLIPLSWGGAEYVWEEPNDAFPPYRFGLDPDSLPFIALQSSRFAKFQKDYYAPIYKFVAGAVSTLSDPAVDPAQDDLLWLEIRRWAYEISKLVPGFPDDAAIRDKETLTKVCAMVIWNAAVVHTADHSSLHKMMDNYPVPFIMRVKPPISNDINVPLTVDDVLGSRSLAYLKSFIGNFEQAVRPAPESLLNQAGREQLESTLATLLQSMGTMSVASGSLPLCWPGDLVYAKMADLLFYRPHGSSLLYDCDYPFLALPDEREEHWRQVGRPVLTAQQKERLKSVCLQFQADLMRVNDVYYDESGKPKLYPDPEPQAGAPYVLNKYGFPKVVPGAEERDPKRAKVECCFSAGIQY